MSAGYSGTPLPKKLGIKEGTLLAHMKAPEDFAKTLGTLPDGARLRNGLRGPADLLIWFIRSRGELVKFINRISLATPSGGVWVAFPKQASKLAADFNEDDVREAGLAHGLVDYKICAIDADWSGLKFQRRKKP